MAIADQAQHLELPRCEVFVPEMLGQASRDFGGYMFLPGVNRSNDGEDVVLRHALEHVRSGARSQRSLNVAVAAGRAEHDDPGVRKLTANRDEGIGSRAAGDR